MKKTISLILSLCMLLSMLSGIDLSAYALDLNSAVKTTGSFVNSSLDKISSFSSEAFSDVRSFFTSLDFSPVTAAVTTYTSGDYEYTVDSNGNATITKYTGSATSLTIPSKIGGYTVATLSNNIMVNNTVTKTVTVPKTVTNASIAFSGSNIEKLIFESGTTKIPSSIASYCKKLTSVSIPDTVTEIGSSAFNLCTSLKSISIPSKVAVVGECAFQDSGLTSLTLPSSVTTLGYNMLYGNEGVKSITIPKTVTKCASMTLGPFSNSALETIIFESGMTKIPDNVAYNCKQLTKVSIPDTVTAIGEYSFAGCISLKSINIPSKVTVIGACAFQSSGLTSLTLPSSVTTLGYNMLYGNEGVKSITIPKTVTKCASMTLGPFSNSALETITFESGMTKTPDNVAFNCKKLTKVSIPDTVTAIGEYSFAGCISLKSINIPSKVTVIGACAFQSSGLTSLTLPSSVTTLGYNVLYGNEGVKSITIPKTVTKCASLTLGPFSNSALETITFENGMTKIPDNVAYNCKKLTSVSIPDTVTAIGEYAFYGCISFESISLPSRITTIGRNAFKCSSNFKVYCSKYSATMLYAIDNDIEAEINDETYTDSNTRPIIKNQSDYYISNDSANVNGYITLSCKFAIKSSLYSKYKNLKIWLKIPSSCNLIEESIKLDGKRVTKYTLDNGDLNIPVDEYQNGTVTYCVEPKTNAKIRSYSAIRYTDQNNKNWYSPFGVIIEKFPGITISAPERTSTGNVTVTGIAPKNSNVEISVNDEVVSTVKASKTGKYSAPITVDKSYNLKQSTVKAAADDTASSVSQEVSAATKVQYNYKAPEIYEFKMFYNDMWGRHTLDLLDSSSSSKIVYYVPNFIPRFEMKFESNKYIDRLYVVSTRNGVKKYLEANWDAGLGCWVAEGYFDPSHPTTYVPGKISFEYTNKHETMEVGSDIDFTNSIVSEAVSDIKNDVSVTAGKDSDGNSEYSYLFGSELGDLAGKELKMVVKESSESVSDFMDIYSDYENVIKYFTKNGEGKEFGINIHANGHEIFSAIHDVTGSKTIEYVLTLGDEYSDLYGVVNTLGTISKATGLLADYYGIIDDDKELRERIDAADMNYRERQEAMQKADALKDDRMVFLILTTVIGITAASVGTGGMAAPALLMSLMLGSMTTLSTFVYSYRMDNIVGEGINLKWIIDPSGYVYEATPDNRLEGVKCTIYYKKDKNSSAVLWNAGEFEQENPLYTNFEGKYAWDVPEGLWQVKYEKEGYKTVYSDWLEVPPPQTDVNISMVSTSAPKVDYVNYYSDYVYVAFDNYVDVSSLGSDSISLTDSNGKTVSFTVKPLDEMPNALDSTKSICKEFMLIPSTPLEENAEYSISVNSNVKSYSDTNSESYTATDSVSKTPEITTSESSVVISNVNSKTVTVNIDNLNSGKLVCRSSNDLVASVAESVNISNGKANVTITKKGTGYALIEVALENSNISKKIYVSCNESTPTKVILLDTDAVTLSDKDKYTVKPVLYPESEAQSFVYESNNASVATVDSSGVITAVSSGSAKITVTDANNSNVYSELKVNVISKECQHTFIKDIIAPSCTSEGYTVYTCEKCGYNYYGDYINALGHDYSGNAEYCSRCGERNPAYTNPDSIITEPASDDVAEVFAELDDIEFTYNGKAVRPGVTVTNQDGDELIDGTDYTVSYSKGRKLVGTYAVTVSYIGDYADNGEETLYFTIKPKGTSIKKLYRLRKGFKVKWKKQITQTSGYQVQYSLKKKFKGAKTVTVKGAKKTVKTVKKLKRKKYYYVRIRTYKTVNGEKIYSSWSKAKKVKTK